MGFLNWLSYSVSVFSFTMVHQQQVPRLLVLLAV